MDSHDGIVFYVVCFWPRPHNMSHFAPAFILISNAAARWHSVHITTTHASGHITTTRRTAQRIGAMIYARTCYAVFCDAFRLCLFRFEVTTDTNTHTHTHTQISI